MDMDSVFQTETETEDGNVIHPQPEAAVDGIVSQTKASEVAKSCPDKQCLQTEAAIDGIVSQTETPEVAKPFLLPGSSNNSLVLNKEEHVKEDDDEEPLAAKRLKTNGEGDTSLSSVDVSIKQAAEVVLILSNMGQMRAGIPPTEVERELMAKARHQLGYLAGTLLLPKDLVSKEGVQNMIYDLGLNKLKKDYLATPSPRKSVAERASDTMKKIEQARLSTMNTAMVPTSSSKANHGPGNIPINGTSVALTAQLSQAGPGKHSVSIAQTIPMAQPFKAAIPVIAWTPVAQPVSIETRGPVVTTATVVGHPTIAPTSTIIPQAQVSPMLPVAAVAPILQAKDQTETRLTVAGPPVTTMMSTLETHSLPAKIPGQVLKSLAVPGMISEKKSAPLLAETAEAVVRDNSKGSMLSPSKVPALVQNSSKSMETFGKDVDLPVQAPRKVEANHDLNDICATVQFEQQDFKGVSTPAVSLNHQTMQVPPQGLKLSDSLAIRANHTDIARNVQKILQSRPLDFRQWEPPSRAYMNAPITCQVCKINVLDVDTILVCDSCEKGVHMKCLQAYNQRGIPKGDWHCPKCLVANNGRPLPPKYGRVGKSSVVRRTPAIANKISSQASHGKKIENPHPKSPQHTAVSNGLSIAPEIPIHVDLTQTNNRHMLQQTGDTSGDLKAKSEMSLAQSIEKAEEGSNEPIKQDLSQETAEGLTGLLGTLSGKENQPSPKTAIFPVPNQQSVRTPASDFGSHVGSKDSQHKQHSNINLHVVKQPQTLSNSQGADRLRMEQAATAAGNVLQSTTIQRLPAESEGIPFSQFSVEGQTSKDIGDLCQEGEDAQERRLQKSTISDKKSSVDVTDQSRATEEDDASPVEWVGDKSRVSGGKTYYQSCSVNGVIYNLHDYALFRAETPNVPPNIAKLQIFRKFKRDTILQQVARFLVKSNKIFFSNKEPDLGDIFVSVLQDINSGERLNQVTVKFNAWLGVRRQSSDDKCGSLYVSFVFGFSIDYENGDSTKVSDALSGLPKWAEMKGVSIAALKMRNYKGCFWELLPPNSTLKNEALFYDVQNHKRHLEDELSSHPGDELNGYTLYTDWTLALNLIAGLTTQEDNYSLG
ncbi:hypothetical protein KI387_023783, partial [Taxus chinensis]